MSRVLLIGSYGPSLLNFRGPLLEAMVAAGHKVFAAAPDLTDDLRQQLYDIRVQPCDITLSRTGLNPIKDLSSLLSLRRTIKIVKPDIILTYTIKPNIWGSFAAALCKVPCIAMATGLGFAFTDNPDARASFKQKLTGKAARLLYRMATSFNKAIIFQNPDDRDDFVAQNCLGDTRKIRMVDGSGVDLSHFTPSPLPPAPHFVMIARLLRSKGVAEYATAAQTLKLRYPQATFSLIGFFDTGPDGISPQELQHWQDHGLTYLGRKSDVRPSLHAASVYVLPSYREGTPRSVLEAMATGRPIITTDAPGCRETVTKGVTGYLVPPRDAAALTAKMEQMIQMSPDDRQQMGNAALKLAQHKYDVTIINRTMLSHMEL